MSGDSLIISKIQVNHGEVVFENPDNTFVAETVMDEIAFTLENMELEHNEIKRRIMEKSCRGAGFFFGHFLFLLEMTREVI